MSYSRATVPMERPLMPILLYIYARVMMQAHFDYWENLIYV